MEPAAAPPALGAEATRIDVPLENCETLTGGVQRIGPMLVDGEGRVMPLIEVDDAVERILLQAKDVGAEQEAAIGGSPIPAYSPSPRG